jgi:type I restriction enzyme M protein
MVKKTPNDLKARQPLPLSLRERVGWGELRESHLARKPFPKPPTDERLLEFARGMRRFSTDAEKRLWRALRNRKLGGFKFRRQIPIGSYIIDFYCHEVKVAVEADGGQHSEPTHVKYDKRRTAFLKSEGIHVMRFWDHDVLRDTDVVREMIYRICDEQRSLVIPPHPNPLPKGEGVRGRPLPKAASNPNSHI